MNINGNFNPGDMNDIMSMFFKNNFPAGHPFNPPPNHPSQQPPHANNQSNTRFKVFYNGSPIYQHRVITEKVPLHWNNHIQGNYPFEINRSILNNNVKQMSAKTFM